MNAFRRLQCIDSHLSPEFYEALGEENGIICLNLINCGIGDNFSNNFQGQYHNRVQSISIASDPFGNKGIKILLKADFPRLNYLELSNTNITTDSIQILKKGLEGLYQLSVLTQQNFAFSRLLKESNKILKSGGSRCLELRPGFKNGQCIYKPQVSKW